MPGRIPSVFFGHGNPMNALARNRFTEAWAEMGQSILKAGRPRGILCVSAHWYINGPAVTINTAPPTIHDFGGFPPELYRVRYPAPGDPALARRVRDVLSPLPAAPDESWGLDHGTWSVLCHVFPQADIPVVRLAIDRRQPPSFHYEIGQRLAMLREEGILIVGSGNVVHNLRAMDWQPGAAPYDWAARFEAEVQGRILEKDIAPLVDYAGLGGDAALSVPTPDHYLPLLYVLGARQENDDVAFPVTGIEGGSISMLAMKIG